MGKHPFAVNKYYITLQIDWQVLIWTFPLIRENFSCTLTIRSLCRFVYEINEHQGEEDLKERRYENTHEYVSATDPFF
jgi:hypothetical protein